MTHKLWTCAFSLTSLLLFGCGPTDHRQTGGHAEQHSGSKLIEHIAEGHDIWIGAEPDADVLVSRTNHAITVCFTAEALRRLPPDCLPILKFSGPERSFTETEYTRFLDTFHDYLLVTYGEDGHVPRR